MRLRGGSRAPSTIRCLAAAAGLATGLAAGCLSACASAVQTADHLFELGYYQRAASAYEQELMGKARPRDQDRRLFRLALSQALSQGFADPAPIRLRLEQLLALEPASPYAPAAKALLAATAVMESREAELARCREEAAATAAELHGLESQLASSNDQTVEKQDAGKQLQARILSLGAQLDKLRKQLAEREAEASRLRSELEALKRIDRVSPP